jgi:signal transduction histidine kinase
VVEVEDSGRGIPKEDQERLFERLYRTKSAEKDHVPGTGLGLTIVKAIVEAHGGRITVRSELGQGTTFRVELPIRPRAVTAEPEANGSAPVAEAVPIRAEAR